MNLKQIPRHQVVVSIVSVAAAPLLRVARLFKLCPTRHEAPPDSPPSETKTAPPVPVALAPVQWFYFRRSWDSATGAVARDLNQLERELEASSPDVIGHHSANGDFSRWVREVVGDPERADALAVVETDIRDGGVDLETGRQRLLDALRGPSTS
jgi:hypothetical protein